MRNFFKLIMSVFLVACSTPEIETDPTPATREYTLIISSGTGGSVSTSGGTYEQGSTVNVTATPNSEYVFSGWSNGSTDNPLTVTVNQNITLTANFIKRKYPLTINIQGEGTVREEIVSTGKSTTTEYNSGTVVRLSSTPENLWIFSQWEGDVSGSDSTIEITLDQSKTITATFIREPFVSRSPQYSQINQTSGEIKSNFYYPGDMLISRAPAHFFKPEIEGVYTTEFLDQDGKFIIEGQSYGVVEAGVSFLDLKNDNLLDMVGFMYNFRFDTSVGYFFVMIDVFGEKNVQIFPTQYWVVPRYELNDYNNDGYLDVMAFTSNSHSDFQGNYLTNDVPIALYLFDSEGNFTLSDVGDPYSLHDGASGDIDNDGDIDVLSWGMEGPFPPCEIGILRNLGNGNFKFDSNAIQVTNPKIDNSFQSLSHRFVDLNNDNCLDIIAGCFFDEDLVQSQHTLVYGDYGPGAFNYSVYWGDCSGNFVFDINTTSRTTILPNNMINGLDNQFDWIVLGQNFIDFDNDGDLDIVTNLTRDYEGFYIQLIRNEGNKQFKW